METGVIAAITIIFIAGFIFARWWRMIRNYREVQKQFEVSAIQRAGRHSLLKVEIQIRLEIIMFDLQRNIQTRATRDAKETEDESLENLIGASVRNSALSHMRPSTIQKLERNSI